MSALPFATVVLSLLFRSQGMLPSFGEEIGKLMKVLQGRALENVSLRGSFQHSVHKHRFTEQQC